MTQTARITLDNGNTIDIEFYPEDAPKTVENFVTLAKKGFYNGLKFHRVVPDFVVQGGCPKGDGTGGPGYTIPAEFNAKKHVRGTVAMARSQHPDSAGSQFYICYGADAAPRPQLHGVRPGDERHGARGPHQAGRPHEDGRDHGELSRWRGRS